MAIYTSILTGGVNNHTTTSEEANYLATDFVSSGVVGAVTNTNGVAPTTGAFACNAQGTPDMTIAVTAGSLYMSATPSGQGSQKFRVRLSANQNVTISANSTGSTKYDWVYVKIDPTTAAAPNLAGDDVGTLVTSRSSSISTDDGTPPTYGYCIAKVTVANGASTITNANITDARSQTQVTAATDTTGWVSGTLPAVSSVTHNGNRSYDVVFASTVASTLSPGMRVKGTKTVAGNGYMGGAFNGSSHYFTKTTPSGTLGTVTNNFTIEAVVMPTSYADSVIAARADSTPNNGLILRMFSDGAVWIQVVNGGTANSRYTSTYQSLPLDKKTHVAATWQGGTAYKIYFDGAEVPTAASVASGTAPTTAGTGGDFSIGRYGAYASRYFPGYISNVAVFDAVLSAATIKQHATYKLTGSETNCIGAWSLDNTAVNQQSPGTNDLTATGGVGYTAISPHGQMGDAVHTDQFCGLVMAVSTTTATIQVPEGITIPTTGGISSMSYSTQGNPFGWVDNKSRFRVVQKHKADTNQASNATFAAYTGFELTVPTGTWEIGYGITFFNATTTRCYYCLSGTNITGLAASAVDNSLEYQTQSPSAALYMTFGKLSRSDTITTATIYKLYSLGATTSAGTAGASGAVEVFATPSGL
jgi:Concanavalin A-like lectin/glucanases superfamily